MEDRNKLEHNELLCSRRKKIIDFASVNRRQRVQEIKYLGFHINEEFESLQHLQIKSKALMRRSYSLYYTGLF